jgi:hypothetical protein
MEPGENAHAKGPGKIMQSERKEGPGAGRLPYWGMEKNKGAP